MGIWGCLVSSPGYELPWDVQGRGGGRLLGAWVVWSTLAWHHTAQHSAVHALIYATPHPPCTPPTHPRLEGLVAAVRALRGGPEPMQTELPASGPAGGPARGVAAALDLSFQGGHEEDAPGLEKAYQGALENLAVGDFDSSRERAYNRHFAVQAEQAAGAPPWFCV